MRKLGKSLKSWNIIIIHFKGGRGQGGLSGKIREKLFKISSKVNFCDGRENWGLGGRKFGSYKLILDNEPPPPPPPKKKKKKTQTKKK